MDKEKLSTSAHLLRLSTLGINFVLCTFAGLVLGWVIQKLFHWGEWVRIVGLFFGVVAGYVAFFKELKVLQRRSKGPPPQ